MTAKEKAKESVNRFTELGLYIDTAKQCAIIAVDLALEEIFFEDESYWLEVKQEIEKL